ncbi:MAG: DNA polymerase I [Candidatus Heteroscillospira sp.]|jgi:DNA polymerase-1
MKLMAIDGNSIVNRAYYGIRMLNAPDGTPTNGIYGFITILQRLLDEEKPDGVCVAFDLKAPTFRHLHYEGYKAQRKGMPDDLAVQMPILKEVLDAMGIRRLELSGWEADDILGTVSRICEKSGDECVIVTGDKDSFQLISDKTRVLHVKSRMGQTETIDYTAARFIEEYGFEPPKMVDLKALMGDSSDNIPGVPGCGEKTAMTLLQNFGSLRGVYDNLDSTVIKPAMRKKLTEGRESAELSYELATICCDAPMEFAPADALWNGNFGGELYGLFMRLGFSKFIERFKLTPGAEEPKAAAGQERETVILSDMPALRGAVGSFGANTVYYAVSDGLDTVAACCGDRVWILDSADFSGDFPKALRTLFAPELKKAGHDIKDIQRRLLELGVAPENWVDDSALCAYLLDATAGGYELEKLTVRYCGYEIRCGGEEDGQFSMLEDASARYARLAARAGAVCDLLPVLHERLRELNMEALYREIELPLCPVLAGMEKAGFLVDRDALRQFGDELSGGIDALQAEIWELAGEEFNINSPKQLGTVLFEKLMLPSGKKTKTGWSTNADVLDKLRGKHSIIEKILDYRTLTKLKSTYADGLLKVIAPDGRIHTSFMMTVTDTGRLSSREPNLQNIPVRKQLGGEVRKMFVAGEGNVLVDADYSQIELRLLAHISGDETMIQAFRSGEDFHAVTASQVFGVPLSEVTALQRGRAKAVNFGIVYGISAFSLAQDIGVWQNEAKAYMDAYMEKYHGVRDYMQRVVDEARERGYVETLYHRRRSLPELKSSNFNQRSFGERVALNMPIQGTAADVMKLAMIRVDSRLKREGLSARLILQVHDELIAECPEAEAGRVTAVLAEEMETVASLAVPLIAEAHTGKSWYEAK